MFENFRERLQTVQQDLTSGIKTLSDKSKDVKKKKKQRECNLSQFMAGAELLRWYEDSWVALHKRAKECAKAAEAVDGEVVMLSAHWEKRRAALGDLLDQLQQIPAFLADLQSITTRIAHLEADFEETESRLMHLENLCGQCELQRFKEHRRMQLENYKKKKRKELESLKAELDAEHAQKVLEMEHSQQVKLKERQKFFEEAFQQDMEQYLSTGYLQIAERREPIGSMSSMEVNVDILEQMDLMDVSDQEALDVFLNSGAEENNAASPALDPEPDTLDSEVTLQVPTRAELHHESSSYSSTATETEGAEETSEEGSASPVVQSDEEEVQADTVLETLPDSESLKNSDDSDSQAL
ncbi:dysbindin-A isoform X2 [Scleropages formosus]|uniref:Dystrobrevin binding protein 1a n=1 Tax=Scleropages formosus TaxID=113540 RepID=A0A8C9QTJ6_SCLFO|nr:dysbindin isoform X2 [Scleropages formosus]